MDGDPKARTLTLALPFAVVGAAAGWLFTGFLANPLVDVMAAGQELSAAVAGGGVAAALGAWLGRTCAPSTDVVGTEGKLLVARVAGGVLVAGVAVGGVIGALTELSSRGVGTGVVIGLAGCVVFGPLCALVVADARRAVRARLGSLVADVDARMILVLLAGALGSATLLALPDWPRLGGDGGGHPIVAAALAGICLATLVLIARRDRAVLARIDRLAREAQECVPLSSTGGSAAAAPLDVGVGEGLLGRVGPGDVYRGGGRAVALLRGDPLEAAGAARKGVSRGDFGIFAVATTLALHAVATLASFQRTYDQTLCARLDFASCMRLSSAAAEHGKLDDAAFWAGKACDYGRPDGCEAVADVATARGWTSATAYVDEACEFGAPTCPEQATKPVVVDRARAKIAAYLDAHHRPGTAAQDTPWKAEVRACLRHDGFGDCRAAGERLEEDEPALAALLYARSCERDNATDCHLAARVYADSLARSGNDVAALWHAAIYEERACEIDHRVGCCEAAELRTTGPDGVRDAARARTDRGRSELGLCGDLP